MKKNNWLKNIVLLLVFFPLLPVIVSQVLAVNSIYLAQASSYDQYMAQASAYDQYMARGYAATRIRNYRQALQYFQQALQAKPGDRYATAAINNVQNYINSRSNRPTLIAGRATGTRGGATRGGCIQPEKIIIPILPTENKNLPPDSQGVAGEEEAPKTSEARPTFFFYLPLTKEPQGFEFSLWDNTTNKKVFDKKYKKSINEPKIVSISHPSDAKALEAGKQYTWKFSVLCDKKDSAKNRPVEGQMKRIKLNSNLQALLQGLQGIEKVNWYASSGYWEDALRVLAGLPRNNETLQAWEDLLKSANIRPEIIQDVIKAGKPVELQPE